jgi:hypothetical protein
VRVRLDGPELVLLASLVTQVIQLLGGDPSSPPTDPVEALLTMPPAEVATPQDPVLARLLPDAYRDDAEAAGEFRRLMDAELRAQKCVALQRVLDDLSGGAQHRGDERRVDLDVDAAELWLYALTDVRLVLGTMLGVTEDMDEERAGLDPGSPRFMQLGIYDWVTWLQDALVRAASTD